MSRTAYNRATRVADQIRMEVADILMRKTKDPRVRSVTVTDVAMSNDLRIARVYVTTMAEGPEEMEVFEGLRNAVGFVRTELGRRLHLRYTPEVLFMKDLTGPRGNRVLALLEEIEHQVQDRPVSSGEPTPPEEAG